MPQTASHPKILLDAPAKAPEGFQRTAQALAQVVQGSSPRFSVGIFGGWGSGKTTLMEAIRRELPPSMATVTFNAWRFERERHLLIPLLDTVRTALVDWSADQEPVTQQRVMNVVKRIGNVVRALVKGLSVEVGLPGATLSYDPGAVIDELTSGTDEGEPKSLYVAAFRELSAAFGVFTRNGADRVVVFVDDLDRCLPTNALDVLESIKLFFDLPGFVFIVGVDETVVQRAVRARFPDLGTSSEAGAAGSVKQGQFERDYVEKIFQVPYRLPPMVADQLGPLLESMYAEADLPQAQMDDFRKRVAPYLTYAATERRINPREVKRFLNTYILQVLVRPDLDREISLALQTLQFRYEWRKLYDAILTDSALFVVCLGRFQKGEDQAFADLSPELTTLPADLGAFLRGARAEPLTRPGSLDPYLSSLETSSPIPTWLTVSYQEIGRVRSAARVIAQIDQPTPADMRTFTEAVREAVERISSLTSQLPPSTAQTELPRVLESINLAVDRMDQPDPTDPVSSLVTVVNDAIGRVYRELRIARDIAAPALPA